MPLRARDNMRRMILLTAGKLMECSNRSSTDLPRVVATYEVELLSFCSYISQVRALQHIVQMPYKIKLPLTGAAIAVATNRTCEAASGIFLPASCCWDFA